MRKIFSELKINKSLIPILSVNFISTLSFSIIIPFLAVLIIDIGGNAFIFSVVAALYSISQIIGAPILGSLSDRYGRKIVLVISQTGTTIAWLIFLIALTLPVEEILSVSSPVLGDFIISLPLIAISIARIINGLTGGNVAITQAYVADMTQGEERTRGFGLLSAASNLGYVVGPGISGLLAATAFGAKLPVAIAIAISVAATIVIIKFLKESISRPDREKKLESLKNLTRKKSIVWILILYFIVFILFNIFYVAFPVFVIDQLGWNELNLAIYFGIIGIFMAFVQLVVLPLIDKFLDEKLIITIGSIILTCAFFIFNSSEAIVLIIAGLLLALGNGIMWPSVLSTLTNITDNRYQGRVQGIGSSVSSAGSIVGLLAGGVIFTQVGSATFYISAFMSIIIVLMSLVIWRIKT